MMTRAACRVGKGAQASQSRLTPFSRDISSTAAATKPLALKWSTCREDSTDIYHRRFKFVALPCIFAYVAHALMHESQQVVGSNSTGFVSTSGDSGLQMTLSSPIPHWMLLAHGRGSLLLCALVFAQKELVRWMGSSSAAVMSYARAHRAVGYATLATLYVFIHAGYLMCGHSTFDAFNVFAILFALPFVVWLVGIWATARLGMWGLHAFLANMLLKGCIATPLSRVGGALLQRHGWELARGYYQGIFGVAALIGVWQVADTVLLLRGGGAKHD